MDASSEEMVSIIMPTYNSESFVEASINSIRSQNYSNWELLITDDCSFDRTIKILQAFAFLDERIKIFQLPQNRGAGIARNNSIKQAGGRFIAFCDSDDLWKPEKLETQLRFMQKNDLAFSYTSYEKIDDLGNFVGIVNCFPRLTYRDMLQNNYVGCLSVMYDTYKIGKLYMPHIRKRQDWALWLKILKQCGEAKGIQEPLAVYRERSDSISSNKIAMLKYTWLIYHRVEHFGVFRSSLFMLVYIWHYFLKKTFGR